jgi:hypothetical protein
MWIERMRRGSEIIEGRRKRIKNSVCVLSWNSFPASPQ